MSAVLRSMTSAHNATVLPIGSQAPRNTVTARQTANSNRKVGPGVGGRAHHGAQALQSASRLLSGRLAAGNIDDEPCQHADARGAETSASRRIPERAQGSVARNLPILTPT